MGSNRTHLFAYCTALWLGGCNGGTETPVTNEWQEYSVALLDETEVVLAQHPVHIYATDSTRIQFVANEEEMVSFSTTTGSLLSIEPSTTFFNEAIYTRIVETQQKRLDTLSTQLFGHEERMDLPFKHPTHNVHGYMQPTANGMAVVYEISIPQLLLPVEGSKNVWWRKQYLLRDLGERNKTPLFFNSNPHKDYKKPFDWPFYGWHLSNDSVLYMPMNTEGDIKQLHGNYLAEYRLKEGHFSYDKLLPIPFPEEYIETGRYNYFWNTFAEYNQSLVTCNGKSFYSLPLGENMWSEISQDLGDLHVFQFYTEKEHCLVIAYDKTSATFEIRMYTYSGELLNNLQFPAANHSITYLKNRLYVLAKQKEHYALTTYDWH